MMHIMPPTPMSRPYQEKKGIHILEVAKLHDLAFKLVLQKKMPFLLPLRLDPCL